MIRTVLKAKHFDPRLALSHRVVSLVFEDAEGRLVDVWLNPQDAFVVLADLQKLFQDHPEITELARPDRSQMN